MTTTHLVEQTHEPIPERYLVTVTLPDGTQRELITTRPKHWAVVSTDPDGGYIVWATAYSEDDAEQELQDLLSDSYAMEFTVPRDVHTTPAVSWAPFRHPAT